MYFYYLTGGDYAAVKSWNKTDRSTDRSWNKISKIGKNNKLWPSEKYATDDGK